MMNKNLIVFLLGILVFSSSCNNPQAERTKDNRFKLNSENVTTVIPELHSISEIKAVFEKANVEFYPELINKTTHATLYFGEQKIAANLGAYLGDLVYVLSTSQMQDNDAEYQAIVELAQKYDFAEELLAITQRRFENDISDVDEYFKLLESTLQNSSNNLSESDVSEFNSYLIFGNYIEKMYIVSSLVQHKNKKLSTEDVNSKMELLSLLANQSGRINELIYIMSRYPDNLTNVLVLKDLDLLMSLYMDVEANRDRLLKLEAVDVLKAKEITAIFAQIEKIRNRIVLP